MSASSDIWVMPPWLQSSDHTEVVRPLRPDGRPITLRVVPPVLPPVLGSVRHRPPPPDVARVLSSIALIAALVLCLSIQCATQ